jgi:hypothetical protein
LAGEEKKLEIELWEAWHKLDVKKWNELTFTGIRLERWQTDPKLLGCPQGIRDGTAGGIQDD